MRTRQRAGILAGCGFLTVILTACVSGAAAPPPTAAGTDFPAASPAPATDSPTAAESESAAAEATATSRPSPAPGDWKSYPPIPSFGARAAEIFRRGAALGRAANVFSKIGDCQNITTYFLADFEKPDRYRLGPFENLQPTIDWFRGSFGRKSLAVKGGLNVASVGNPLMANPDLCLANESPLACELRLNNPSLVIISFEEAWDGNVEKYGTYLRSVIEYVIDRGVVPVVATKADNLEGGDRINTRIAQLAWEYDIPLWNFWGAVQPLPAHGLSQDGFHLTQGYGFRNFFFDLPSSQWSGWMERNLTALQVLDAARRELTGPTIP